MTRQQAASVRDLIADSQTLEQAYYMGDDDVLMKAKSDLSASIGRLAKAFNVSTKGAPSGEDF